MLSYFKNYVMEENPTHSPIIVNNKLISNFTEKANHFNAFFASQCTPVFNDSVLPNTTNSVSNISLSSIQFKDQDILKNICSLNWTLLFLIYIDDLPDSLESSFELFADDISLFSTVYDPNMSGDQILSDFGIGLQMIFN